MDSSARSSEPIDGTVAAAAGEQEANSSYDEPTHNTQVGGHSGPDNKSSPRGTDEHPFEHPARSCFSDQCGHKVTKGA
jgi:hypothetical protein